ncbi:SecDF P1 head subdomain-containing protein [Bordetella muralis]|jgi:preprotein translocase subunit SecD|uniref:SecDF P1 head subdomain-containing protein n=1 Tax=Bordetella muralis TaxID=1649130 RepID=UPI0039EFB72D
MRVIGLIAGFALMCSVAAHAETVRIPVQSAAVGHDDVTNQDFVDVKLTSDGQRNLAAFTRDRVGKMIHIRADDVILASPTVMSPIEGGALRLSPGATGFGGMSAQEMVKRLSTGSTIDVSDGK